MNRVLGRWIAVLRMDCGMTRGGLAERLGVPASTVARWECESETVPPEYLGALAETLHIPLDDLLALHAQSSRRLKARLGPSTPSTKRILKYPVKGTLEEMLELGGQVAHSLHLQLKHRLTQKVYDEILQRMPRDSALQLLAIHHVIGCGADLRKVRLLDLGCGLLVTQRARKLYDGDRERYALILPGDDWLLVLVPQVSIGVPSCPEIYRSDLLGLYVDSYGHRHWIDITVEEPAPAPDAHANCPLVLGMPRFRYDSEHALREDFGPNLIAEIRRYMMSDVVHRKGVTTLRVRQPARMEPPLLRPRSTDSEPGR